MEQIRRAFRYWLTAIIKPRQVFEEFNADPDRLAVSLWIMVLFSIFYTITAGIFALTNRLPAIEPWMPVAKESYYFYQVFWTIPWGLATGILMAGVAHVMAVLGRENAE